MAVRNKDGWDSSGSGPRAFRLTHSLIHAGRDVPPAISAVIITQPSIYILHATSHASPLTPHHPALLLSYRAVLLFLLSLDPCPAILPPPYIRHQYYYYTLLTSTLARSHTPPSTAIASAAISSWGAFQG